MLPTRKILNHTYELIVVGAGGLVGSSALREAAEIALSSPRVKLSLFDNTVERPLVLGIEQFNPPHDMGSSHGETRITRLAGGEGDQYPQLAKRSHQIWKHLEEKLHKPQNSLCHLTGGLIMGAKEGSYHGSNNFIESTKMCASKHGISHESLSSTDLQKKFSQFNFTSTESGYFETTMGYIRPEACIKAHLEVAKQNGAELQTGKKVITYEKLPNKKMKITAVDSAGNQYIYHTKKLILAAGAWLPQLLKKPFADDLKIYRQTVYWFEVAKEWQDKYAVGKFPPFIWDRGSEGVIYGFPIIQGDCIKIGSEQFLEATTPDKVKRTVSAEEIQKFYIKFIRDNFKGVTNICIRTTVCLYTMTNDFQFRLFLPEGDESVVAVSACSGHGAKHSAAIGAELAKKLLTNKCDIDVVAMFGKSTRAEETHQLRAKL